MWRTLTSCTGSPGGNNTMHEEDEVELDNQVVEANDPVHADFDGAAAEGEMIGAVTLMGTLPVLGVDIVKAIMFVASLLRSKPTIMELYGRGSIKDAANHSHRNLNVWEKRLLIFAHVSRTGSPGTSRRRPTASKL